MLARELRDVEPVHRLRLHLRDACIHLAVELRKGGGHALARQCDVVADVIRAFSSRSHSTSSLSVWAVCVGASRAGEMSAIPFFANQRAKPAASAVTMSAASQYWSFIHWSPGRRARPVISASSPSSARTPPK